MRAARVLAMLLLAQSATACSSVGSEQTSAQPASAAPSSPSAPPPQRSIPTAERIVLPQGVELSDIRVVGRDLVVMLPDGTEMVILDGAVSVPQLVIGNVEIPAANVAALLVGREPQPAAGPPNMSTRLFVPIGFNEFERFAAVAMIAFPQVPASAQETNRYQRICEAYLTILPDAIVMDRFDPDARQMVTIWPRKDIANPISVDVTMPTAAQAECNRAIRNYAYPVATAWLARVPKRAGLDRTRPGPFLVAWAPSSEIGNEKSALLIFDLSDFERTSAIQKAFRIWKAEIENDPKLWNKGWNITRWKAHTAAKLDRYGTQISSAIKMVPWLKS